MRISTFQLYQQGVNNMLQQQVNLSATEAQLSSGKRLVHPSDDPAASLRSLQLQDRQTLNQQYLANLDTATSRLQQEGDTLSSTVDLLQRVRELAVSAQNGTLTGPDRQAIAVETKSLLDGLVALGNTQDANGQYLFAGYQSASAAFTSDAAGNVAYNGDQGQSTLQVSPTRRIAVGDNGADVFLGVPTAGGAVDSLFGIVKSFSDALSAGNVPSPDALTNIDAAINRVLTVQADVGSRQRAVDQQTQVNQSFGLVLDQEQSRVSDLDYVSAISRYNREMTALQASQQAFSKIQGLSLFNFLP
jgi:flagellar hook-associated protein 3 FlgL